MKSIRSKLTLTLLVSMGLVWIVTQSFVYRAIESVTIQSFDQELESIEKDVSFFLRPVFGRFDRGPRDRGGMPPGPPSGGDSGPSFGGPDFGGPDFGRSGRSSQTQGGEVLALEDQPLLSEQKSDAPPPPPQESDDFSFGPAEFSQRAKMFSEKDSGLYFAVYKDGVVESKSPSLGDYELPILENAGRRTFWDYDLPNGDRVRVMATRSPSFGPPGDGFRNDEPSEEAPPSEDVQEEGFRNDGPPRDRERKIQTVVLARSRSELDASLKRYLYAFLGIGLCGAFATVALVNYLLGVGLKPLKKLAAQVETIDESNLDIRIATDDTPRELIPVNTCLNDLLKRLEQSFDRERRFSSDASHELRTPVAELTTLSEIAIKWPESAPSDGYEKVLGISKRMEMILDGLLKLARLDAGQVEKDCQPVDLTSLVQKIWKPHKKFADAKGITTTIDIPQGETLQTNADLFALILNTLFSNLSEYAPSSSEARIYKKELESGICELVVENQAPELTSQDVEHMFERFWRRDFSRTGSNHSGLGLSIALASAKALNLKIKAELSLQQTLSFHVRYSKKNRN
ncbi:ATP-binding protein [Pelagicoccus albus]|uniref:histidine kinase n=1 Tax=Pelagicoccus albus TaxID=415222 RepID=A0A7X1B5T1_9BACT|nr:ATP-binding protein [Pelagicoccus albus]MBC2606161.1 hypothetical protein [Pelagicoccus albus]